MKFAKNKTIAIAIAIFLMLSMSASMILVPTASAHTPAWQITPAAFIDVEPSPVGVGQKINIYTWLNWLMPGALSTNDIRFHNYKIVITAPDNTTSSIVIPTISDPTSSAYTPYTPTQVGTYSFVFIYPGETYTWSGAYQNDTFLQATSRTVKLTVQEEAIPIPISSYPLPTEYWTEPIEGQNNYWNTIASNWLGQGSPSLPGNPARVQANGIGPNSAHVMWTRSLGSGGIVPGNFTAKETEGFYHGSSYQYRFYNPIIMDGTLFYDVPLGNALNGGGYIAVDLRTGEQIWYNDQIAVAGSGVPDISFGYYYAYESPNQHGVIPNGWLFSSNFGRAVDPTTGIIAALNITNVPSGYDVYGPSGETLRLVLDINNKWLAEWNSSKVFDVQTSGTINASLPSRYDWNVTIPQLKAGTTMQAAIYNDVLLGMTTLAGIGEMGTPNPYTAWAISLKPASRGQLMWQTDYAAPPNNVTRRLPVLDPVNRVFILRDKETFQSEGYSIDTGNFLWATTPDAYNDFEYYDLTFLGTMSVTAYGRLYHAGYSGVVDCYDTKDGTLLWTYGNGGEGNSTYAGLASPYGHYPIFVMAIADGKIYLGAGEHSADTPLYKGFLVRCVNATTGEEVWTLPGYLGYPGAGRAAVAEADGFLTFYNGYSSQVYCVGKGPSALTVEAPMADITQGSGLVIRGTVTDISAGTQQNEQAARFPYGVPAVSDASQSAWMEYVYMQKPKPTNATGVPVSIDVIDSNGNYRNIGTTTSDTSGTFSFNWTPDIPGSYTVIATFAGSESYWPSSSETSFAVDPAAPTAAPTATPQANLATTGDLMTYMAIGVIAIIIAIAIVLLLRKHQ
jgi:hypothetical protein